MHFVFQGTGKNMNRDISGGFANVLFGSNSRD